MLKRMIDRLFEDRRGSVLVELALSAPVVFLLCVGAADFARLFYHAHTIKGASSVAAMMGAQDELKSADSAALGTRAASDTANLSGVSTSSELICVCPGGSPFACGAYNDVTCAGYGDARVYVSVNVAQDFKTIGNYIKIPQTTRINETTFMRVK